MMRASVFLLIAPIALANSITWDEARMEASRIVQQLSIDERVNLLQGKGWDLTGPHEGWYVGNIPGIPRLGIPAITMQDSSGGFRVLTEDTVGSVTVWPSLLAASATWDTTLVERWAGAIADEFSIKGANTVLGPGLNVQRVARNGRNFEYLSGEDPYLGAQLGAAYISGVQSRGQLAVMKHFVLNNQETNRGSPFEDAYVSMADERTLWELYYPPFEAGIQANVSAVMCSYNKVGRNHASISSACGNAQGIREDLKGRMGFKGFVVSDWYAAHSTSDIQNGLDMDMPGDGVHFPLDLNHGIFGASGLKKQPAAAVEEAAIRVLTPFAFLGLLNKTASCANGPPCKENLATNARSDAHDSLATEVTASSIVLLKNGGILPFASTVKSIGIFGSAANAKPFDNTLNCHGSKFCMLCKLPGLGYFCNLVTAGSSALNGDYYSGGGSGHVAGKPEQMVSVAAGIAAKAKALGIKIVTDFSDDLEKTKAAAATVDVAIVVGATTSHEQADRKDLSLDHGADDLIAAVAEVKPQVVVITLTPGAILTPWRSAIAEGAIVNLFLGGQATGTALANVLFGEQSPAGRLPITFPSSINETIEPSTNLTITYSEGLKIGYRNPTHSPAFSFGHGLSYTHFTYSFLSVSPCAGYCACLDFSVTNAGLARGQEVAQLYVEFPAELGISTKILKGFKRTAPLAPGASEKVRFVLTERDCSTYSIEKHDFVKVDQSRLVAHVGGSSVDIRFSHSLGDKLVVV